VTTYPAPICLGCKHLIAKGPLRCDAFPDSIPNAIITSRADHRKVFDGDHDIQFEPQTSEDADYAALLFDREAAKPL
jgi:hypothetical protein